MDPLTRTPTRKRRSARLAEATRGGSRTVRPLWLERLAAGTLVLVPDAAFAYVGPGAGISAIGAALALIAAVLLAIVGFVWYPLKRLLRRRRKSRG